MIARKILNGWNDKKFLKSGKIRIASESTAFERRRTNKQHLEIGTRVLELHNTIRILKKTAFDSCTIIVILSSGNRHSLFSRSEMMIYDVPGHVRSPNSQYLSVNGQHGDTYCPISMLGKGIGRYPIIFIPIMVIIYRACLGT